jgi:hypothetical protein
MRRPTWHKVVVALTFLSVSAVAATTAIEAAALPLYLLAMAMTLSALAVAIRHEPRAARATAIWGALGAFVVGAVAMYFLAGLAAR